MCADQSKPPNSREIAGDRRDLDHQLTELAYETAVSPERYDDLMAHWDSHIRALLTQSESEPQKVVLDANLARHFSRAIEVFERMGRREAQSEAQIETPVDAQELAHSESSCALAFDARGNLIATNPAARELLGLSSTPSIEELPIDGKTRASLRDALSATRNDGIPRPLVVRDIRDRPLVLLTNPPSGDGVVIANAVQGGWSASAEQLLIQGFGITAIELTLLRGLYDGHSLRQIADQRSRSIGTIRTQLKAVQQKTGAHSQVELMRLVTGLIFASNTEEAAFQDSQDLAIKPKSPAFRMPKPSDSAATKEMVLRNGRRLIYDNIGPVDATDTAIFLHGMLDSPSLPLPIIDLLRESKTRCFCIHRPGYGNSDPNTQAGQLGELLAADIDEFLDVQNLQSASLIGHLSGGVLACIVAAELGERITGVVNINAGVPIVSRQQFEVMMPRQRVIALTARYAPKALPLMLRAGIALLDSGGERNFMRGLHRNSPRDHRLAQRPEVFAQIAEGYRFAVAQGHHAFQRESVLVTSNWDEYVDRIGCPVTYINGAHDGVVAISSVRDFVGRHPQIRLLEHPDYGQLMLYGHATDIGKSLIAALRGVTPHRRQFAS